jgi:hypothetical protein
MAETTYVETYKGHVIYYYRYIDGGSFGTEGISGYFYPVANLYAAIDALPPPPPPPPEGPQAPSAPSEITLPWPWDWIAGPLNWLGSFFNWIVTQIASPISGIGSSIALLYERLGGKLDEQAVATNAINSTLKGAAHQISQELIDNIGNIMTNALDTQLKQTLLNLPEALSHSPEWKTQIEGVLDQYSNDLVRPIEPLIPSEAPETPKTPQKDAADRLMLLKVAVSAAVVATWVGSVIAEAAGFGQLETVAKLCDIEMNLLGFAYVGNQAVQIPLEQEIMVRARQFWAAQYTPQIPSYMDLIEMVVKEKLTLDQFKEQMKYLGFSEYWSQKIWDKHFIPPSLTDILTAYRRQIPIDMPYVDPSSPSGYGVKHVDKMSVDDVHGLMKLVDLDPIFQSIFDTRFYADVPLTYARWMWETGSVKDVEEIREIVRRQGVDPKYEEAVIGMITGFPVRTYRRRYWMALQAALQAGVITPEYLKTEVADNPKDADVAYWIIKIADMRGKIAEKPTEEKAKLIGVGDLKKAYVKNMIDADKLRIDLQIRGYQTTDVDLLIKLLDEEKVVTSVGGEKVALSVPELKAAWKYKEVTEDYVRIQLQLRGLSLEEVNILINTWNKQLGVEGAEVG